MLFEILKLKLSSLFIMNGVILTYVNKYCIEIKKFFAKDRIVTSREQRTVQFKIEPSSDTLD